MSLLNKTEEMNFQFMLNKNGNEKTWLSTGILVVEKGTSFDDDYFGNQTEKYKNKIVDEEIFGVRNSTNDPFNLTNTPLNLTVVKKSSESLKLNDGPIEVSLN